MALMIGLTLAGALIFDFALYTASGASDCVSCNLGQSLLGWGLIVLPVGIAGCLLVGAVRTARRQSRSGT